MKIAILNKYQFKVFRGAETFVFELSEHLSINNSVDIISKINYWNILKKKYDIIIPTNGRFQVFVTRIISWISGAKMVVSGQSGAGLDDRLNLYAFPDVFVGLTDYQCSWAKNINPLVKVVKIPNGVDLSKFTRTEKNKKDYILAVGAFTKEKRHDLTVRAVTLIKDAKLLIVGSGGEQKEEIERLCNKLLPGRFKIVTINHDNMPEVYKHAAVLAFPTVPWESFGIVMVEAMACGVPVVATRDSIRQEIVGDAGVLVDPTLTEKYADALKKAINKNWKNVPRIQAEKFSWVGISQKYEEIFKSIAKK